MQAQGGAGSPYLRRASARLARDTGSLGSFGCTAFTRGGAACTVSGDSTSEVSAAAAAAAAASGCGLPAASLVALASNGGAACIADAAADVSRAAAAIIAARSPRICRAVDRWCLGANCMWGGADPGAVPLNGACTRRVCCSIPIAMNNCGCPTSHQGPLTTLGVLLGASHVHVVTKCHGAEDVPQQSMSRFGAPL